MRRVILTTGLAMVSLILIAKPPLPVRVGQDDGALDLAAPAGERPTHIDRNGETVLPNGRLITPQGVQVTMQPHPQ